jgi:hypothetical protein
MVPPGAFVDVMFYLLVAGAGVSIALQQMLNANPRMELGSMLGRIYQLSRHSGDADSRHDFC